MGFVEAEEHRPLSLSFLGELCSLNPIKKPLLGGADQRELEKRGLDLIFPRSPDLTACHCMRAIQVGETFLPCRGRAVHEPRLHAHSFIGQSREDLSRKFRARLQSSRLHLPTALAEQSDNTQPWGSLSLTGNGFSAHRRGQPHGR
jgi:hypothetical protein